jgi:hypothetical protein
VASVLGNPRQLGNRLILGREEPECETKWPCTRNQSGRQWRMCIAVAPGMLNRIDVRRVTHGVTLPLPLCASRARQSECWHAIISESLLRLGDAHGTVRAAPADSLNRVCGLRTTSSPHASAAVDNSNAAMLRITNTADRFILIAPAGQLRRRGCSGRSDMDPAPIFWLRSGNPCMLGLWRDPDLPVSTGSWHTAPSSFAIRVGVAGVQAIEHGGHGFQQGVIVRLK